eukprot:scaffold693055_cov173-Attheya_sp.AAC.1
MFHKDTEGLQRFLMPVSECSFEDMHNDPWPVPSDKQVARCTGCALSVPTSLLDLALLGRGAH